MGNKQTFYIDYRDLKQANFRNFKIPLVEYTFDFLSNFIPLCDWSLKEKVSVLQLELSIWLLPLSKTCYYRQE